MAPFFALKYAPKAMGKLCKRGVYTNAAEKDTEYGSLIVVSSVASTYGGESMRVTSSGEDVGRTSVLTLCCRLLGALLYYELACCFGSGTCWCCGTER